jgi:hypothetical protein
MPSLTTLLHDHGPLLHLKRGDSASNYLHVRQPNLI